MTAPSYCIECGQRDGDVADTTDGPVACPDVTQCPACGWGVCEICALRDHDCRNEQQAEDMARDRAMGGN